MTPEQIKFICDIIKLVSSVLIIISALFAVLRALTELGFIPKKQVISQPIKPIKKKNTKKVSPLLKKNIKKPRTFVNMYIFIISIGIILIFIGFYFHILKNGKLNFFAFDKIWGFGDVKTTLDSAVSFGLSKNFLNLSLMPLYPFMIGIFKVVLQNEYVGGFIVSFLSTVVACAYIYRLAEMDTDEDCAFNAVKYFLVSPFAFMLFLPIKYSLFVALAASSLYFLRKKNYNLSGTLGFLAFLCDFSGIMLIIPIIAEFLQEKHESKNKKPKSPLKTLIIPVGIILFLIWVMASHENLMSFFSLKEKLTPMAISIMVIFCIFAFIGLIFVGKYIRKSYLYYCIGILALPFFYILLSVKPSLNLYIFPLFIALSALAKNKTFNTAYTAISAVFMGLMFFIYINFHIAL